MPAYRSEAEAEIRTAVVQRLREIAPRARIIHEINVCDFGNRVDVLAVDETEIYAVEIKSEKDKLDRLPDQIKAMRGVTKNVYAAIHEKFLVPAKWTDAYDLPDEARGAVPWVYPVPENGSKYHFAAQWETSARWGRDKRRGLPPQAIDILWRKELHQILKRLGISGVSKINTPEAIDHIRWNMTGQEITKAICSALRVRECIEADPVMAEATFTPCRV